MPSAASQPVRPSAQEAARSGAEPTAPAHQAVAEAVLRGLSASPRSLPPWLFYDQRGSELFEQITGLAEYYLTRVERSILTTQADAILAAANPRQQPLTILELGAGSATKTSLLLEAALRQQPSVDYCALDVSASALAEAEQRLKATLPGLAVTTRRANYTQDLSVLSDLAHTAQDPRCQPLRMVLWIGSSIGNFEPEEARALLGRIRAQLTPGDTLVLGTDYAPSAHKPVSTLLRAYADADGVTADFNRNVLVRLNRELGADFKPECFAHEVRWSGPAVCSSSQAARIEMHLKSLTQQRVALPELGLALDFAPGETIHTENSYKFTPDTIEALLEEAGFRTRERWSDPRHWFGVSLACVL